MSECLTHVTDDFTLQDSKRFTLSSVDVCRFCKLPDRLSGSPAVVRYRSDFIRFLLRARLHHYNKMRLHLAQNIRNTTINMTILSYLAAAASRFLAFAAAGSTDRLLAASSSLLEAMEMFFRLPITCTWSSFFCEDTSRTIT